MTISAGRYLDELPPSPEDVIAPLYDALTNYIRVLESLRDDWKQEGDLATARKVQADIGVAKAMRNDLENWSFTKDGKGTIEFWKTWAEGYSE